MSHRVTTQTEIKDKELALQALKRAGLDYRMSGADSIVITSAPLQNVTINLHTGLVSGDTDYGHTKESFSVLLQNYGESKYRQECLKQGITVDQREVDPKSGDVTLFCSMG